jgi:hypothetical protein
MVISGSFIGYSIFAVTSPGVGVSTSMTRRDRGT